MPKYISRVTISVTVSWFIVGLAMLFYVYDFFLQVSPSVMVPQLMHSFNIKAFQVGNISAFYFYIYTIMQLPVGILYDKFRMRNLLLGAVAVCTIGSFLFGFSHETYLASFSRFLMGLGASFAFVGVLKIATKHLPPNRLALVSGITTALGMVGAIIGDLLLTDMIDDLGWRLSMWLTGGAGVIIFILFFVFLRQPKKKLPYSSGQRHSRTKELFKHLWSLIKIPSAWINAIVAFLLFVPVTAFAALWSVPFLSQALGFSAGHAAVVNSFLFLGVAIGGPSAGLLSDKIGRRKIFLWIGTLATAILLGIVIYIPGLNTYLICGLYLLTGLFIGTQTLCFPIARELSPPAIAATAFAFTNLIINLSGSVFQPVIGGLLDLHQNNTHAHLVKAHVFLRDDYTLALSVVPACCLIAFVLVFFVKETHGKLIYSDKK